MVYFPILPTFITKNEHNLIAIIGSNKNTDNKRRYEQVRVDTKFQRIKKL
jgi:hypothetical protein